MGPKLKDFLQKRWVRIVGVISLTFYSYLSLGFAYSLISNTIFRPPNQVFPATDGPGWIGYLLFLSIIGLSGILAVVTAYFMKGIFKILYVSGIVAFLSSILFFPLSFSFNAYVEFHPDISNTQFLVGSWINDRSRLMLNADSTYTLEYDDGCLWWYDSTHSKGTWSLDHNRLHLSDISYTSEHPWMIRKSSGYYFITYEVQGNPDAWTGDLGLMREDDWEKTH